jgi:cystathionine gamma-synthase
MDKSDPSFADSHLSVHGGEDRNKYAQSLIPPIAQTSTFVFNGVEDFEGFKAGQRGGYEYGRYGNPTQRVAEEKIAVLEGAEDALLFSSGMAAICSVLLAMLRSGQHMIVMEDCYRMTDKFCRSMKKFGIEATFVKAGDMEELQAAVRPETRLLFSESPTNPHLHVLDLNRLVSFAKENRLKLLIDSTLATPINQRPISFGVDLVIHSATKYMGGHNDLMAGVVCGSEPLVGAIREFQSVTGATVDPHTAYLLIRGLKTMALRVRQQNETALELARYLERSERVRRVFYPGLESHKDHAIAREQMRGYGGVVSFEIDGSIDEVKQFIQALKIPQYAPSLGGVETLVQHPATVSHYDMSKEERLAVGITDELVRYSVGIEEKEVLIKDIECALSVL